LPVYLDASVIVPLITIDHLSVRARVFMESKRPVLLVSDFACVEFASAIARKLRLKELTSALAMEVLGKFDVWRQAETTSMQLQPDDISNAASFIRRLDLTLRAPDAMHIAMARRAGADLATFDKKMADSALVLGVPTVVI
jgi:predicted nucleic acid-binding protein